MYSPIVTNIPLKNQENLPPPSNMLFKQYAAAKEYTRNVDPTNDCHSPFYSIPAYACGLSTKTLSLYLHDDSDGAWVDNDVMILQFP